MDLLSKDQIRILKRAFETLDTSKKGVISVEDLGSILDTLGQHQNDQTLKELVASVDRNGKGTLTFEELCELGVKFMGEEEEDLDKMRDELREAFRLYDREGDGYITTEVLKEILQELDPNLSYSDLEQIIEEVDADGSGTVDFDEFMEMMMG
ncbi:troponin C, isoallergen Bla g 6.0101-like isoform X2 [Planococcus citri]|uniref:troponin C, isoallergen Bla g 6.0101-like isoform X2 n=1 Tax=Planococcus citri TaxID=170843 RepID=UPI0031F95090